MSLNTVVLNGPPGSGINRQGRRISHYYNWQLSSTDKLLIDLSKSHTPRSLALKEDLDNGILPDPSYFAGFMEEALRPLSSSEGIVLIGYTRTHAQALTAKRLLDQYHRNYVVFDLQVSEEIARTRVREKARRKPERVGGNIEAKLNRWMRDFKEFNPDAMKLYRLYGKTIPLSAELTEDKLFEKIIGLIS